MAFNRWKTREGRRNFSVPLSKPVPDNRYSARSVRSFDPRPAKFSPRLTVKRICSRAPTEFQPLRTPLARFFFEAALRPSATWGRSAYTWRGFVPFFVLSLCSGTHLSAGFQLLAVWIGRVAVWVTLIADTEREREREISPSESRPASFNQVASVRTEKVQKLLANSIIGWRVDRTKVRLVFLCDFNQRGWFVSRGRPLGRAFNRLRFWREGKENIPWCRVWINCDNSVLRPGVLLCIGGFFFPKKIKKSKTIEITGILEDGIIRITFLIFVPCVILS